jgi:3-hydroxyisobutyrate dehydrogenase-like beta-hydroxyacid dehydrogenase
MKVGFIGLGNMGSGMARNLIKAGHTLTVFNRTKSRAEEFRSLGATVAGTPGEAAAGAEVVITMLADDGAVEDAVLGPGRVLQSQHNKCETPTGRLSLLCPSETRTGKGGLILKI